MVLESRRRFFRVVLSGAAVWTVARASLRAQRGLDQFLLPAPPCRDDLTPRVPAGSEYRPNAPVKSTLVETGMAGDRMTLSGYVTGLACGRIRNARVEFWQADATGKYDTGGFQLRGAALTDQEGKYSIETIVPGAERAEVRRIHVRVAPAGKKDLTTVLFFPDDPAAVRDRAYKPSLTMKRVSGASSAYRFDFLLDV